MQTELEASLTAQRIHQDLVAQVGCRILPVGQTLRVELALCYPGSRLAYRGPAG